MTITSHPSEATLLGYASGNLPVGASLALSAHLWMCRSCRAPVAEWEAAGGAVLESLPEAELPGDALARTLAQLDVRVEPRVTPAASPPDWLGNRAASGAAGGRNQTAAMARARDLEGEYRGRQLSAAAGGQPQNPAARAQRTGSNLCTEGKLLGRQRPLCARRLRRDRRRN